MNTLERLDAWLPLPEEERMLLALRRIVAPPTQIPVRPGMRAAEIPKSATAWISTCVIWKSSTRCR